jgi:hypothetical protein
LITSGISGILVDLELDDELDLNNLFILASLGLPGLDFYCFILFITLHLCSSREDLVNWSMNLPPSVKPNGDRTLKIPVKIYKPGMGKIFILIQKDFVPSLNVIMITVSNFSVGETSGDKRRCSPIFLGNKLHYEQRMKGNSPGDPLTLNGSYLDGLSYKKYIPVIFNGLIRVDGREMPTGRVIGFGNFIRRF